MSSSSHASYQGGSKNEEVADISTLRSGKENIQEESNEMGNTKDGNIVFARVDKSTDITFQKIGSSNDTNENPDVSRINQCHPLQRSSNESLGKHSANKQMKEKKVNNNKAKLEKGGKERNIHKQRGSIKESKFSSLEHVPYHIITGNGNSINHPDNVSEWSDGNSPNIYLHRQSKNNNTGTVNSNRNKAKAATSRVHKTNSLSKTYDRLDSQFTYTPDGRSSSLHRYNSSRNINSNYLDSEQYDHQSNSAISPMAFLNAFGQYVDADQSISTVNVVHEETDHVCFSWRSFLSYTGPGFLMCIAYLDPGNLEADLQVGAYTGYELIWVLFLATGMGLIIQTMAARLGTVTGKHLALVCKENYSRTTSLILWVCIELAIIGSDLQEIIGSAVAFQILFGFPLWVGCVITFIDTFTFLGFHYFGIRKLEMIFFTLIVVMTACFFLNFYASPPAVSDIIGGFEPKIHSYGISNAVGVIGAVIMPHNIYLHSALVLSRKIDRSSNLAVKEANKYFTIDSGVALFITFIINLTVVGVFARHFFDPICTEAASHGGQVMACLKGQYFQKSEAVDGGLTRCGDNLEGYCQEIGLEHSASALEDVLGKSAKIIFGIGLLAAGQSSTMTGTYAGQYVMEGFLDMNIPVWMRVTFTRLLAIGPGLVVAVLTENMPALSDHFQQWINIMQSVMLAFALIPVLYFTSNEEIMGKAFVNSRLFTYFSYCLAVILFTINIYLVMTQLLTPESATWARILTCTLTILYILFSISLLFSSINEFGYFILEKLAWCLPFLKKYVYHSLPSTSSVSQR